NATPPATAAATDRTPATPEAEPASLAFDDHGRLVTLEQNAFRVWNNPPRCSAGEIIPREGSSGPSRFGSVILAASHGGRFIALTQPSPQPPPPPRGGTPSEKGAAGPPPNRGGRPPEFGRGGQVLLWKSDEPGRLAMVTPPTPEPGDGERGRFGPRSAWRSLAVAPDGDRLYLIDLERNLHVWDLDGEAAVNVRWPDPPRDLSTLALSPDGTRLAAGGRSGVVTLFDTASGEPLEEFDPESDETDGGVWSLAFSPDGGLLAVGTQQGPVVLWSLDDTTLPKVRLPGQRGNVAALAFDPQGRYLATAGSDRVVDVWDLGTLRDEFNRLGLGW
ncbi:MAG: WD40 repeat domain-containing protein, partial [Isosphaeraceae bacterium]